MLRAGRHGVVTATVTRSWQAGCQVARRLQVASRSAGGTARDRATAWWPDRRPPSTNLARPPAVFHAPTVTGRPNLSHAAT